MASLSLGLDGKFIKDYQLAEGTSLTIGRQAINDVVIENLSVSGRHAKIEWVEGKCLLTDLQSKNGTFVNEVLVKSHWLEHGDAITIGRHVLLFYHDNEELRAPGTDDAAEKTVVMDSEQYQEMLAKSFDKGAGKEISREAVGYLFFTAGARGNVVLTRKLTKIGKDSSNDVVIRGFLVGKTAATISQRPSSYHLSYAGGLRKPKVNGVVVNQTVKLKDLDTIQIGSVKMQFIQKFVYKR
jgi:pSer/pThr/pTyr-binding forkhead associated (FHA) protein